MSRSGSIQAGSRRLRYVHLRRIAIEGGIANVAVGHNRNDQAETVLINLLRGTGLDGMTGMRPIRILNAYGAHNVGESSVSGARMNLIRPLLRIRRRVIEDYATTHGLIWRDDTSNRDLRYTRNRIRHEIIPEQAVDKGHDFIDDIAEAAEAVAGVVDDVFSPVHARTA